MLCCTAFFVISASILVRRVFARTFRAAGRDAAIAGQGAAMIDPELVVAMEDARLVNAKLTAAAASIVIDTDAAFTFRATRACGVDLSTFARIPFAFLTSMAAAVPIGWRVVAIEDAVANLRCLVDETG